MNPRAPYIVQKAGSSRCPVCDSRPVLLAPEGAEEGPIFFICRICTYIGQAGVGPVKQVSAG